MFTIIAGDNSGLSTKPLMAGVANNKFDDILNGVSNLMDCPVCNVGVRTQVSGKDSVENSKA